MTMLPIGSKRAGFTLVEVMVATAVLAFGTVLIFEAFLTTLNSVDYYERYLSVAPWMRERMAQAEQSLISRGDAARVSGEGVVTMDNRAFTWRMEQSSVDEQAGLEQVELHVSWTQGTRTPKLKRALYVLLPREEEQQE